VVGELWCRAMSDGTDLTDYTAFANAERGGFNETLGLVFVRVTVDEVVAEVPVGPHLLQPYGLVHGGVHASIVETLCSVGAAMNALPSGKTTVGLENSTSFLRATRGGKLVGRARPVHRGQRTQAWEVEIRDDSGELVAIGRVRMMLLDEGAALAGKRVRVETG
jgi:1,4-dihydroxy-2-naphthoyl-CoA hydrolase